MPGTVFSYLTLPFQSARHLILYFDLETNPIRAGLAQQGRPWAWSSANAHSLGHDPDDLLTFELWNDSFGNPNTIIAEWLTYLTGPLDEVRANAARLSLHTGSRVNRPTGWASSPSPPAD